VAGSTDIDVTTESTPGFKLDQSLAEPGAAIVALRFARVVSSTSDDLIPVSVPSARSQRARAGSTKDRRARPSRALVAVVATEPDRTAANMRAAENLRRHAWRALRRVAALVVVDALCFIAAVTVMRTITHGASAEGASVFSALIPGEFGSHLGLGVALLVGTTVSGAYGPGDAHRHLGRLFVAALVASLLPVWSHLWTQSPVDALHTWFLAFAPLFVALVTLRTTADAIAQRWSHGAGLRTRPRALLVGTASDCLARQNCSALTRRAAFDVLGFVDLDDSPHHRALGAVGDLERLVLERAADTVVLCGLPTPEVMNRVLRAAVIAECTVMASAPQLELPAVRPNVIMQHGQPLLELRPVALRAKQLILKRALDIIGSVLSLILLAPVFAVIALLIVLDTPGPVLFVQFRLGRFGRPIRCLKFRSMSADAEARLYSDPVLFGKYVDNGYKLPASSDDRITKIGRFLRRTSLDELPQLWNVLKGEMSLVGPRPIVPDEIHHYNGESPLLLSLKPGITGAWQVSGRSAVQYPQRVAVELEYVEGWSLWRDISILIRTVPAVLAARGAH
jgi:exopolysaccharide biosynthesis polyprenyl glycosylphosphotransferase